ncbi:hypothetical protein, partial [Moorena sp. SIO3B2]|uniref:hypothetical protein n=1 Tax=Moorena sp. SIO3B2 TaxID=2607827 RepID=UPI0013C6FEE2
MTNKNYTSMSVSGKVTRGEIESGKITSYTGSVSTENKTSITVPSKANLEDVKVKSGEIEIRPDELADIKAEIKQLLN